MNTVLEIVRLGMLVNKRLKNLHCVNINIDYYEINVCISNKIEPDDEFYNIDIHGSDDDKILEIVAYLRNLLGDKYINNPI